ncbi:TonB-dependent receptor [Prevotella sp. Rep29]|uniref:TonB-dependent receptor n=1 Tax=Prevotella sp. Rep29 TaxID=2691580 RepID=UPI001C6ECED1|nr:TonB-dependent receptor [Prevotella sp. Rep29]
MKKTFLFLAAPIVASMVHAGNLLPAADDNDSLRLEHLQEVVVRGVNAQKNAPFAVANIKKTELQSFAKTGKELPFLFSQTPGILAWSENGVGTGTTYMRIRGAGGSRINVTLDGVPLNSPEDQCVFWANMNSYASLLGKVQIQRGVGTSTNGDGAFGGTIALSSKTPDSKPSAEVSASYGSYNTYRVGGAFSTGLLWNHLILDGAYHETNTDGYIHGTQGRSGSYYGGLSYAGDRFALRYKLIGNFERTGQAWNGVTAGNDDLSLMDGTYGEKTGIKTYKDLYKAGLGRYNSLYEHLIFDDNGYHTERHRMADGSLWKKTTDNFWQHHHILSLAWDINERWATTASLHYTHGYGYYDEFRYNNKLSKFGLANITDAQGNTLKRTDFVRKKGLTQDTYGAIWNISYKNKRWDIIGGLSVQQFDGNHFGYITYVKDETLRRNILGNGDYQYYDSDAKKFDGNAFLKALYHLTDEWDLFADAQYRHVSYKTDGVNDKFYDNGDGTYVNQRLDINEKYNFFNPKAGISFHKNGHQAYASAAISNREPERNNFTDNGAYPAPKAERLFDYEAGYSYSNREWRIGVNLYYMDYKDQFVQTGQQSDIGENLTTNIKRSYRMGIELSAGCNVTPWLSLEGNAALSQNKVKDFDEYASVNWDDDWRVIHYDNSTLAFSPSTILNGFANFHYRGFQAVWHTNFVSRQYLDNTENKDRSLPGYSVTNLSFSYTAQVRKAMGVKGVVLGLDFNNIFARRYATSGWVYSSIVEEYGHPNDNRYYQIGFIPAAGFTAMGSITLKF